MIISFAWTTPVLLQGRKTVTRRQWTPNYFDRWCKAYDKGNVYHDAYDRNPRNGGKKVGRIRLSCRPYTELLRRMPESDLSAEGGMWDTLEDFMGDTHPDTLMSVIRFDFLPLEPVNTPSLFDSELR